MFKPNIPGRVVSKCRPWRRLPAPWVVRKAKKFPVARERAVEEKMKSERSGGQRWGLQIAYFKTAYLKRLNRCCKS